MRLHFWGTRGSIPVSLTAADIRAKLLLALQEAAGRPLEQQADIEAYVDGLGFAVGGTYGGHSSCVQIETGGDEQVLLDMGSGARPCGQHMIERFGPGRPQTYHVFMTHLHWDHIMGFPFFTPIFIHGNRLIIHSCHENVEYAFRRQQRGPSFPVDFGLLGAEISFEVLQPDQDYDIAGLCVRAKPQCHAGDSYGWRFIKDGKRVVYSTDSEHKLENLAETTGFADFFAKADAVIFDAMYSLADAISVKADWGHSSNMVAVELCQMARAKRLIMFHHEPAYDDKRLEQVLVETRRLESITRSDHAVEVLSAWDGLEVSL